MLVNHGNCIGDELCRVSVAILEMGDLLLLVAQLVDQAFPQVAAGNPGRIHLPHYFTGFGEIGPLKAWRISVPRRWRIRRWRRHACMLRGVTVSCCLRV